LLELVAAPTSSGKKKEDSENTLGIANLFNTITNLSFKLLALFAANPQKQQSYYDSMYYTYLR
jgi:hypothetical protein